MDFVAFDFETANPKRSSACELGITVVSQGMVCETRSWLIKPTPFEFHYFCVKVHGIQEEDVASAPTFDELWPEVSNYFEGRRVVAHNASFDTSVLRHTLDAYDVEWPDCEYHCTLQMARQAWPQMPSHSLGFLAKQYGIEFEHHRAAGDAEACARLALLMNRERGTSTICELIDHLGMVAGQLSRRSYSSSSGGPTRRDAVIPPGQLKPLAGVRFAFTGRLVALSRPEAHRLVRLCGAEPDDGPTKQTDFVVVGEFDLAPGQQISAKHQKAMAMIEKGHHLRIISEEDFLQMLFETSVEFE